MDGFYWSRIFSINQSNVSYQKDFHQSKISLDITASQLFLLHSNIIIRSNYGGKVIDCYTNDNNNKNNNICAGAIIKSILRKGKEIKTFEVNSVLNSLYVVYDGGDIESYNIKRENDSNNENNNKNNNKNKNNNNNNDYKYYSDIVDLNTIYEGQFFYYAVFNLIHCSYFQNLLLLLLLFILLIKFFLGNLKIAAFTKQSQTSAIHHFILCLFAEKIPFDLSV